jgi:hypothetical protein
MSLLVLLAEYARAFIWFSLLSQWLRDSSYSLDNYSSEGMTDEYQRPFFSTSVLES